MRTGSRSCMAASFAAMAPKSCRPFTTTRTLRTSAGKIATWAGLGSAAMENRLGGRHRRGAPARAHALEHLAGADHEGRAEDRCDGVQHRGVHVDPFLDRG